VLREIRADPQVAHIPVIILTAARIEPRDVRLGLSLGADDYITKPFDWRELAARIRAKLRVKQAEDALRRRNRELGLLPAIGQDLSARLDVEELTLITLQRSVEHLSATSGHLVVFQPDGSALHKTYLTRESAADPTGDRFVQEGVVPRRRELAQTSQRSNPLGYCGAFVEPPGCDWRVVFATCAIRLLQQRSSWPVTGHCQPGGHCH
jgi:hypothetical protein